MSKSKKTKSGNQTAEPRKTWTGYYPRVTRNKKKYTRKQKHKTNYKYAV